jgi:PAS domain S-box-containing protein
MSKDPASSEHIVTLTAPGKRGSALRVLHLEDDRRDAELICAKLEEGGFHCDLTVVETREEFLAALDTAEFDLILADFKLPSFDALSAIEIVKERHLNLPFIFVSGTIGEELAIDSLRSGATDYVLKTRLSRLVPAVLRALKEAKEHDELRKAEASLERLRTQNELILKSVGEGILGLDPEGNHTFINPAAADMLGYAAEELLDKPGHEIWHHTKADGTPYPEEECPICLAYKNGEVQRIRDEVFWRKDGSSFPVSYISMPILENGRLVGAVVTFRDITERKRSQEELQKHREHLEDLVEQRTAELISMNVALQNKIKEHRQAEIELQKERDKAQKYLDIAGVIFVVLGTDQCVELINKKGCECLGYQESEIVGKKWFDNFLPETDRERVREGFARLISGETEPIEYFENPVLTKSGGIRLIAWHNALLKGEGGNIAGTLSSGEDITERRRSEEELRHVADELARSNSDLKQFAYVASHDLQAPLGVASMCMKLFERRYKDKIDKDADELIDLILDSAARMKTLIKDLLDYSQVSTKGKSSTSIDSSLVLRQALSDLREAVEKSNAEITYDPLPVLKADPSQMTRLFQNLIGNAVKFHGEERPKIHISADKKQGEWIFSVRDNGIGIDSKYFDRIFDVFQRLHTVKEYEGTGIGLSICRKIVERHGGKMWVESKPGNGSNFIFTLPDRL